MFQLVCFFLASQPTASFLLIEVFLFVVYFIINVIFCEPATRVLFMSCYLLLVRSFES